MNELTRNYLNDEAFHREYLRDHEERDSSFFVKAVTGVAAAGATYAAFKRGHLRDVVEPLIQKLGQYRSTEVGAMLKGVRNFSKREKVGLLGDRMSFNDQWQTLKADVSNARIAHKAAFARGEKGEVIQYQQSTLAELVRERNAMVRENGTLDQSFNRMTRDKQDDVLKRYGSREEWKKSFMGKIHEHVNKSHTIDANEQIGHIKQTGHRFATLGDVMPHLSADEQEMFRQFQLDMGEDISGKLFDKRVLVNEKSGKIADMRDFHTASTGILDTIADDFTTPFVKINPLRMMYLNRFSRVNPAPTFHVIQQREIQPALTKGVNAIGEDHFYLNGEIIDITNHQNVIKSNTYLVEGREGPFARYYRNMAGLSTSQFQKGNGFWNELKYTIGSRLKIGFQDEPIGRDLSMGWKVGGQEYEMPNFLDPTTLPSYLAQKIHNVTKPYESSSRIFLDDAFGSQTDWLVFNKYRSVEEAGGFKNYAKQYTSGRNNLDDVTTASIFPYAFFERMNATLNQVGMGLPTDSLGSAFDVAKNLMLYRVLPVLGAVEGWKYLNYESENLFGVQFEDAFAKFYMGASTDAAALRDATGITEMADHFKWLFPGGDQVSALPVIGGLFGSLDNSEEETREYWANGEDPVRKGRWWEMGNTPFTGGKIEYFEPNWARRTLADVEFTDTMYGSREEYFENAWYPTLRHPFAPIKHFLTDPYHWEKKHYYDRPYMKTGGFSEFEDFPIVGPILNNTIGEILKPTIAMHQEYWTNQKGTEGLSVRNVGGKWVGPSFDDVGDDYYVDPVQARVDSIMGGYGSGSVPVGTNGGNSDGMGVGGGSPSIQSNLQMQVESGSSGDSNEDELIAYETASGATSVYSVPNQDIFTLNQRIKEKALSKAEREARQKRGFEGGSLEYASVPMTSSNQLSQIAGNVYYNLTEMGGIYGFASNNITGELNRSPEIASSNEVTSYRRNFWDMDAGNLGGDANEIFRRFLPRDADMGKRYNPVANTMPSWMPGSNYYTNFQTGDPYTKVKKGEMRLPGEGYEKLYGIDVDMSMDIGASFIGYDAEKIRDHILRRDEFQDDEEKFVTSTGTDWHAGWEARMMREGIGLDYEQYVSNKDLGIGGFYDVKADHAKWLEEVMENATSFKYYRNEDGDGVDRLGGFYDAGVDIFKMRDQNPEQFRQWIQESLSGGTMAILDPKTVSDHKYNEGDMFFHNVQQVNFYLHETGQKRGYLIYVNREQMEEMSKNGQDPAKADIKVYGFDYNPELLNYSVGKVQDVRNHIKQGMKDGTYGRGDFYDMMDRFRILADTAPYSEEYRNMKKQIRTTQNLTEADLNEIREIEDQVSAKKEDYRLYPYRFKTSNVKSMKVTVKDVLQNDTFTVDELDNPVKLAGVTVSNSKTNEAGRLAKNTLGLKAGDTIRIEIDGDELTQVTNDTYKTIRAVVYKGGINKNRELIESGAGKEKEDDFTPAGVHARFTKAEIAFGSMWETFAHLDTPIHTKFMHVASPVEEYERRMVYGKSWQSWDEPVDDFFIPWYQNVIRKHPVAAVAIGTYMGSLFGNTRYGKMIGATVGAVSSLLGSIHVGMTAELTGEQWIPERRREARELTEYMDKLKYVKYRRLYEWAADQAPQDVRSMIAGGNIKGDSNSREKSYLQDLKRRIRNSNGRDNAAISEAMDLDFVQESGISKEDIKGLLKLINKQLTSITNERDAEAIDPLTARALTYYQMSEQTFEGYDPGDPIQNFLSALPRRDRQFFSEFIEAPEEERGEIYRVAPEYMRNALLSSWGMPTMPKEDLTQYFMEHGLPDKNWIGWDDRGNLNDVKVKMVRENKLDPSEHDIWAQDEQKANASNVQAPKLHDRNTAGEVQRRLEDVLRGIGLEDVQVNVRQNGRGDSKVDADIVHDRREEIIRLLNGNGVNLI